MLFTRVSTKPYLIIWSKTAGSLQLLLDALKTCLNTTGKSAIYLTIFLLHKSIMAYHQTTLVGLSFCLQNVSGSISKATNAKETIIAAVHAARSVFLCV